MARLAEHRALPREPFVDFCRGMRDDLASKPLVTEEDLDRSWGRVTWTEAPVPFHNGQILPAEGSAWITLHSLEPRILALLGLSRVPVETFGTAAGRAGEVVFGKRPASARADALHLLASACLGRGTSLGSPTTLGDGPGRPCISASTGPLD